MWRVKLHGSVVKPHVVTTLSEGDNSLLISLLTWRSGKFSAVFSYEHLIRIPTPYWLVILLDYSHQSRATIVTTDAWQCFT